MTQPQVTQTPAMWITEDEDPLEWFNSVKAELERIEDTPPSQ